ncbi:MAG: phage Gp19/Gp15/Gp42 family protein [Clostridiales Family XIII bacterium]|jgi:hypothetical protein|nr:phage Gp19/Gp15/Gp42 family protein [Clostridiales Family XIII bacterium]
MTAYATVSDIEERLGRNLTDIEKGKAEAFIDDATIYMATQANIADPPPTEKTELLKSICCAVVLRAFQVPVFGVASVQQTAGPYSENLSFANPSGDLYLTSGEKKMLGIGKQRIGAIRPKIHKMGGDVCGW